VQVERYGITQSEENQVFQAPGRDLSAELGENGFVRSGEVQSQSIAALRDAKSLAIRGRTGRQTELEWNSDCEAVITDFEEVSDLLLWTCLF
jgi:hypothetical protein